MQRAPHLTRRSMLRKLKLLFAGALAASAASAKPQLDATPDLPPQLGYKILWFAIKSADPAAVVAALAWPVVGAANWQSGLAAAMQMQQDPKATRYAFVSPAVRGWVLVVGGHLPYPDAGTEADTTASARAFVRCKRGSPNASPTCSSSAATAWSAS